jgi:hypothetical protein
MNKFLHTQKYKGTSEIIMEQYWNGTNLLIVTKNEGKWTLYNHTQNKKISTSKDYSTLREKIYNPE